MVVSAGAIAGIVGSFPDPSSSDALSGFVVVEVQEAVHVFAFAVVGAC